MRIRAEIATTIGRRIGRINARTTPERQLKRRPTDSDTALAGMMARLQDMRRNMQSSLHVHSHSVLWRADIHIWLAYLDGRSSVLFVNMTCKCIWETVTRSTIALRWIILRCRLILDEGMSSVVEVSSRIKARQGAVCDALHLT